MNQPIETTSPESIEQMCDRFFGYTIKALHRQARERGIPFEQVRTAIAASTIAYLAWNPTEGGESL